MSKIEKELLSAAKIDAYDAKSEDRQGYLKRLWKAVDKLDDDVWDGLSEEAQKWQNAATKADENKKAVKDFDGAPVDKTPKADDKPKAAAAGKGDAKGKGQNPPKPATKAPAKKAVAPAKKAAPAKAPAKKAAAEKPEKGSAPSRSVSGKVEGVKATIKAMLCKKPNMTKDDLIAALKGKGEKLSVVTVTAVRSEFRHTVRVMRQCGVTDLVIL